MPLRDDQIRRYARHIVLPEIGGVGQERLLGATIEVVVGADRPANLVAMTYLAAAGVGHIVVSGDVLGPVQEAELAGLAFCRSDLGRNRLDALRDLVAALNPDVEVRDARAGDELDARIDCGGRRTADAPPIDALIRGGDAATAVISALGARR